MFLDLFWDHYVISFYDEDLTNLGDANGGPDVIRCSDDWFARVLDYRTYRLRNKKATHGTLEARKMGRMARNMKYSFAGYPNFTSKEGLKVFYLAPKACEGQQC